MYRGGVARKKQNRSSQCCFGIPSRAVSVLRVFSSHRDPLDPLELPAHAAFRAQLKSVVDGIMHHNDACIPTQVRGWVQRRLIGSHGAGGLSQQAQWRVPAPGNASHPMLPRLLQYNEDC